MIRLVLRWSEQSSFGIVQSWLGQQRSPRWGIERCAVVSFESKSMRDRRGLLSSSPQGLG
jgi:hypothetical protein